MTEVATMKKTVMTGLVGLVLSQTAQAETSTDSSIQVEIFAHNNGVMNETKARGTMNADGFDVGYLARNRLFVGYDGTVQETLMQEISVPLFAGFRPTAQVLLKDTTVAPQLGFQYWHKTDNFLLSSAAIWRFQEDPVVEWRTTATYSYNKLALEAENFTWLTVKDPALTTGTVRLHAGYAFTPFQIGVAGEVFYPVPNPVAGVYGRVKL